MFSRASIRLKLAAGFTGGLLLVAGVGIFSLFELNAMNGVTRDIRAVWLPKIEAVSTLKRLMTSHGLLAKRRIQTRDFRQMAAVDAALRGVDADIASTRASYRTGLGAQREKALFEAFGQSWKAYTDSFAAVLENLDAGQITEAFDTFQTVSLQAFDTAVQRLDRVAAYSTAELSAARVRSDKVYGHARTAILGAVLLAVTGALGAIAWISMNVSTPLLRVSEAMKRLTAGDETASIPDYSSRQDEIGILADAVSGYRASVIRAREMAKLAEIEHQRLQAAVASMPIGLCLYDAEHRLIISNGEYAKIYDLPEELTVPGTSFQDLLSYHCAHRFFQGPSQEERAADLMRDVEAGNSFDAVCETGDGRSIRIARQPLNGGWVAVHEDLTQQRRNAMEMAQMVRRLRAAQEDLKRAAAAAAASNEAKSAFLANMSHEIRTPLNGILGMAQALASEPLTPTQRDGIHTILESGQTLMVLLNDALDLSKIEAGKLEISPSDGALREVVESLHKLFLPRAAEKGIELRLEIDEGVPEVLKFDAVRVRQCASNLISNAIKFTNSGHVGVAVSARAINAGAYQVTATVSDSGVGMSRDVVARLFSEFYQADDTITRHSGGTGLGLAITRKLARLMSGDVVVSSTPGKGSTFTLTFTAARSSASKKAARLSPSPSAPAGAAAFKGVRVLLVDDNAVNRQVARLLLAPFGAVITEATNGAEALAALDKATFDVVLLDVHMPVMDGMEAIRHIRAAEAPWRNIPVIALTADAMRGDQGRLLAAGMSGYASKPVEQAALVNEIRRVLGRPTVEGDGAAVA